MKCFTELQKKDCPMFAVMKEYNSKVAPLCVIGTFLNYCGNHILHYMQESLQPKTNKYQTFYPGYEVVNVTLLKDGYTLTTAMQSHGDGKYIQFKSKFVVLNNGAV